MRVIRDSRAMTDMASDIDVRLSETQKAAARRVIASFAKGVTLSAQVADATDLMMALGVHPTQVGELDYLTSPGVAMNQNGPLP